MAASALLVPVGTLDVVLARGAAAAVPLLLASVLARRARGGVLVLRGFLLRAAEAQIVELGRVVEHR